MTEKFILNQVLKFAVTSEEYQAYTVQGNFAGIEAPDPRIERHSTPQKNTIHVTLRLDHKKAVEKRRLLLWINPKIEVDKTLWTRLTPIVIDNVFGLAQVYASLTDN